MARCQNCGRVNREGSIFCQDCGTKLQGAGAAVPAPAPPVASAPTAMPGMPGTGGMMPPPGGMVPGAGGMMPGPGTPIDEAAIPATRVRQPTPVAGVPVGLTCPACRAVNPPGMNFCKQCGTPLRAPTAPAAAAPATPPGGLPPPAALAGGLPPPVAVSGARPPGGMPAPAAVAGGMPAPASVAGGGAVPGVSMQGPASAPPVSALRPCPACGQATPSQFAFCQHCGTRLTTPPVGRAPSVGPAPEAVAATIAVSPTPPPQAPPQRPNDAYLPTLAPSGAQLAQLGTLQGGQPLSPGIVPAVGAPQPMAPMPTPSGGMPQPVGVPGSGPLSSARPAAPITQQPPLGAPRPEWNAPPPVVVDTLRSPPPVAQAAGPAWGRLVAVHRDGSDGQVYLMTGEHIAIGRTDGEITFADDRYLAPRHAQLERRGAHTVLRVLDDVNGCYVRIVEPHLLADGDTFLLGKQLLRFETITPMERDAPPAVQHGVLVFGSPPRQVWGRLRQLLTTGQTRDVIHLSRPDVTIGREDGELRFSDDEFMSRRHASLAHRDGRAHLADLGSSNGTYVRLRAERELRPGDLIRLGDQLLRFELQ